MNEEVTGRTSVTGFSVKEDFVDPYSIPAKRTLFIGQDNTESEQKEIDYLENQIQPVLCEIMPLLLKKKPANPVPVMIKKIQEIQETQHNELVAQNEQDKIQYLKRYEQKYLGGTGDTFINTDDDLFAY